MSKYTLKIGPTGRDEVSLTNRDGVDLFAGLPITHVRVRLPGCDSVTKVVVELENIAVEAVVDDANVEGLSQ